MPSVKIPALAALLAEPAQQGRKVLQALGDQVTHLTVALHIALPDALDRERA